MSEPQRNLTVDSLGVAEGTPAGARVSPKRRLADILGCGIYC